jgi:hypothetical protein
MCAREVTGKRLQAICSQLNGHQLSSDSLLELFQWVNVAPSAFELVSFFVWFHSNLESYRIAEPQKNFCAEPSWCFFSVAPKRSAVAARSAIYSSGSLTIAICQAFFAALRTNR